jgi:phosphate-selective porin OprO/OprP
LVSRATFAPFFQKDVGVLHTGMWGSWRSVNNNFNQDGTVRTGGWRYQSQPDSPIDRTNWIDTGNLTVVKSCSIKLATGAVCPQQFQYVTKEVNNVAMFGAELAGAYGPAHFTAEYMQAQISGVGYTSSDVLEGFSVQSGFFLTGEKRPYDVKKGTWDRVIPKQSFIGANGWGAWEVAYRYDLMDMNTLHINGGSIDAGTLALNWYLNPRVRFMTNWTHIFSTNNGSAAAGMSGGTGKCAFPAQGSSANIGCFNGLNPDIWSMAVRFDY